MNENHISKVKIGNFKSIIDLEFDCKRLNLFIGKPNVGKSNILEAMGVHSFFSTGNRTNSFVEIVNVKNKKLIKHKFESTDKKTFSNLHLNSKEQIYNCEINTSEKDNKVKLLLSSTENFRRGNSQFKGKRFLRDIIFYGLNEGGELTSFESIKTYKLLFYKFKKDLDLNSTPFLIDSNLRIPFGENLPWVINNYQAIYHKLGSILEEYGFYMVIDDESDQFEIQRKVGNRIYKIPYHLLADTLRRYIFHYAAIESNENATLLFEEPEAHCYIEYVKMLAWDMIKAESNQFFVTTHSPTVISTIVENMDVDDYTINIVYYEDYQTKIHQLTKAEIQDSIDYNYDLLLNLDDFIKEKVNA